VKRRFQITASTTQALSELLSRLDRDLFLVDVGARWGAHEQWKALTPRAKVLCFEPDQEEAARLTAQDEPNITYLPIALGATDGSVATLHMTSQPACSSLYAPVEALYRHYPALADIKPTRTVALPLRSLDAVLYEHAIEHVDAIKLDTQGSELDILRGATTTLRTCAMIDIEVEFNAIYEGQPLFCDVDRFMRDNGFVLWRLSDICHYAPSEDCAPPLKFVMAFSPPQTIDCHNARGGQLFWAQALYVRAEYPATSAARLSPTSAFKAAAVMASAGLWDLALTILSKGDNEPLAQKIAQVMRNAPDRIAPISPQDVEIAGLRAQIASLDSRITEGAEHLALAQMELAAARADAASLRSSTSWRITAPIRALRTMLRRNASA
jgi:FkbM family methyltransferase